MALLQTLAINHFPLNLMCTGIAQNRNFDTAFLEYVEQEIEMKICLLGIISIIFIVTWRQKIVRRMKETLSFAVRTGQCPRSILRHL